MARDKYVSKKEFVNGFSFADLGVFYGLGSGIISAVYSLVLLDIFQDAAKVGLYFAIYSVFSVFISLFANELFRSFSKSKLFFISLVSTAVFYFMMSFPVKSSTFIALDFASSIPLTLIVLLIPLFMSDFSKNIGIEKLNGRYQFWMNIGGLVAPVIAMFLAGMYGNRFSFFVVSVIYLVTAFVFKYFGIVQEDKKIKKITPRKTFKVLVHNTVRYFKNPNLARAFFTSFGYAFGSAMRGLYVPIIVIQQGFTKETLGLVLMLGVIPHILLAQPLGYLAKKYGVKIWVKTGLIMMAILSVIASFATGYWLLFIFVFWQIAAALISLVRDLLFFDAANKQQQSKYLGVFKSHDSLTKVVAPLIGAGVIYLFGTESLIWLVVAGISVFSLMLLPKNSK